MFPVVRVLIFLLLAAAIVCFGLYLVTRQPRYFRIGAVIVKWTVIAGLMFFGVLIVERLVEGRGPAAADAPGAPVVPASGASS